MIRDHENNRGLIKKRKSLKEIQQAYSIRNRTAPENRKMTDAERQLLLNHIAESRSKARKRSLIAGLISIILVAALIFILFQFDYSRITEVIR